MENNSIQGIKESDGKLFYELDWRFIEAMAKRMADNKSDKYPPFNWKKPIDVEQLKQAINRHHIEVMSGNYRDGEEEFGHVVAYAVNAMMIWYQLKTGSVKEKVLEELLKEKEGISITPKYPKLYPYTEEDFIGLGNKTEKNLDK